MMQQFHIPTYLCASWFMGKLTNIMKIVISDTQKFLKCKKMTKIVFIMFSNSSITNQPVSDTLLISDIRYTGVHQWKILLLMYSYPKLLFPLIDLLEHCSKYQISGIRHRILALKMTISSMGI